MLTKTINNTEYKFYASAKEMPIKLYNQVQRFLLQDMGIGSTMEAIDERFAVLDSLLSAGKIEEAIQERENQRFAFYTMIQGVNYRSLAFACHIFSIGGERLKDYSEENLQDVTNDLNISVKEVDEIMADLKKNFALN